MYQDNRSGISYSFDHTTDDNLGIAATILSYF